MMVRLNGCNNVNADIKKEFDSEPVYNKKYLKTKILSYGNKSTNFQDKEIAEAGSDYTCLAVINVNSGLKKDEHYYRQALLKECK